MKRYIDAKRHHDAVRHHVYEKCYEALECHSSQSVRTASSSDEVSSSRTEMSGCCRKRLSCQTVCTVAGACSKNVWNLISWKLGQSSIIWALSSREKPHRRHWGSMRGSILDPWYLRKLWPVKCLMQRPRSRLPGAKVLLKTFCLGLGKIFLSVDKNPDVPTLLSICRWSVCGLLLW